jgi:putative N6-adenine-specific DNA methylase
MTEPLDLFLVAPPGLEPVLAEEVAALGYEGLRTVPGGVTLRAAWPDVWRLNLWSACAVSVLVRVGSFRANHLAQLDKRARGVDWAALIPRGTLVAVEAACKGSRIYHSGAAAERVTGALEAAGTVPAKDASLRVLVRIKNDACVLSLDASGEPLFRRGFKQAVGKAPLRETMAASFLRACGFDGTEPVLDPMCGSGTIVLEAAARAAGLAPGRGRPFAFEALTGFEPSVWEAMRAEGAVRKDAPHAFLGSDRDAGAVRMAGGNAERAGLAGLARFERRTASEAAPPDGPPGLVLTNPPYGARLGDKRELAALYRALGQTLRERFGGWRVGIVTSEEGLARASGLSLEAGPFVPHGPLKVRLWQGRV